MNAVSENEKRTLTWLIKDRASIYGEQVFLYYKDEKYSYKLLNENANRIANALKKLGIGKGDHVVTLLPNVPEYLYVWWGITKLGAVEVPINHNYKGEVLGDLINRSDAKAVFVWHDILDKLQAIQEQIGELSLVIGHRLNEPLEGKDIELDVKLRRYILKDLMDASTQDPDIKVYDYDPANILFTSGTTGPPKGAIIPHGWIIHNCQDVLNKYMGTTQRDIFYNCYPMFNATARYEIAIRALSAGGKMVLTGRLEPKEFWSDIRRYNCTEFVSMGTAFALIEKEPPSEEDRNHTLEKVLCLPLPADFQKRCETRFGVKMATGYGTTEIGYINFRSWESMSDSCGPANCGFEQRIVDEHGNPCQANEIGEIVVRPRKSHIMLKGYYKMPEAFEKRIRDCWWHTGDLGKVDETGNLYFYRRKEESIRFHGYMISLSEVEKVINDIPAVIEAACYGVADELGHEQDLMAAIKIKPGAGVSPQEILGQCENKLPYFMIPAYIRFVESFDKTPTMRIIKTKLEKEGVTLDTWNRRKSGYRLRRDGQENKKAQ